MSKFKLIYRSPASEDSHSIWRAPDGRFVVSDQSGYTPETTEDGPVYVDERRAPQETHYGYHCSAFLEDGTPCSFTTDPTTIRRLRAAGCGV